MGPEKGPDSSGDRIYGFVGEVSIYHSPDIVFAKDVFIHSEDSHSVGRLQQGMDRFAFFRVGLMLVLSRPVIIVVSGCGSTEIQPPGNYI